MEAPLRLGSTLGVRPPGCGKRLLDLALGAVALTVALPLLLLLALAIRLDSPGPALFRQRRIGRGGRPFTLLKLRTMRQGAEGQVSALAGLDLHAERGPGIYKFARDPRVTRAGRVIRRHGLDELPQLVNVLRGEMSLVGPRPLLPEEDAHVGADAAALRRTLRPGITGPWQVSGANSLAFAQMLSLDCDYASRRSLALDLRLLARTLPLVLRGGPDC